MKRIILYLTALLLLFVACEKNNCKVKYPKDIKPIDWENYNDVYTVYWNYKSNCTEAKYKNIDKTLMLQGYVAQENVGKISAEIFYIVQYPNTSVNGNLHIIIRTQPWLEENESLFIQVQNLLDTADLTKKIFIKGLLGLSPFPTNDCCTNLPEIRIININDIYFK